MARPFPPPTLSGRATKKKERFFAASLRDEEDPDAEDPLQNITIGKKNYKLTIKQRQNDKPTKKQVSQQANRRTDGILNKKKIDYRFLIYTFPVERLVFRVGDKMISVSDGPTAGRTSTVNYRIGFATAFA